MKFDNLIHQVLSEEINKLVINELKNASYEIATRRPTPLGVGVCQCRSNQEYDYYTNQLEELKSQIPDNSDTIIHLIRKGIESDYDDENIYKCVLGNSLVGTLPQVSKFLLDMGFDGVVCGNQYCIFNFKKLNQNLYY